MSGNPCERAKSSVARGRPVGSVAAMAASLAAALAIPAHGFGGPLPRPGGLSSRPGASRPPSPSFEADLLPLFRARCLGCHGDGRTHAGLDLRTRDDTVQGGRSGPAVVPGSAAESRLYRMVASGKMPPGGRLGLREVGLVRRWIEAGAPGRPTGGHWAFRPPVRPSIPHVKATHRVRNPIDAFLLAALEHRGLGFSPEGDRRTLIRRVTFDLIGLPPTPEEVSSFLADRRPDAYERLVDRLLADPRYGERWARHWLDVAGYAESEGVLDSDVIRPNAWRYRDTVIRSLNADKPYDRFLREQIAGDELIDYREADRFTPEMIDTLAATGFLRTAVDATRDDFNPHQYGEYQYHMLHDMQTILGSAVLGLTIQCSRCHDHKYEPLSQRDYYRLQAFFSGAVRPRGTILPSGGRQIVLASAAVRQAAKESNQRVDAALEPLNERQAALLREFRRRHLEAGLDTIPEADRRPLQEAASLDEEKRTPEQRALVERYRKLVEAPAEELASSYPEFKQQRAEIREAIEAQERKRVVLPSVRAFYDQDANPPPTPILVRGDWQRPGAPVWPAVPAVLADPRHPLRLMAPPMGAVTTGRRKALAEWLTRADHPLTARVIVNRLWAHHFEVGLVPSVDNFGRSGVQPTNQALLDWMAVELTRGVGGAPPWTLKALHRLMVTSSAYCQGSRWRAEGARLDPENRLLWRKPPRRLEAEAIRDATLAVSGTLDPKMFGEPVGIETRPTGEIVPVGEEQGGRRSIYLLVRRSQPVTLLNTFDAPIIEVNCTRRTASTTPTQALALLNGSFVDSQSRHFARRLRRERGDDAFQTFDAALVDRAYLLAFSRPPTPVERVRTLAFLREQVQRYWQASEGSEAASEKAWADVCHALLSANEFVFVD